jgi:HlyD family secretion protein
VKKWLIAGGVLVVIAVFVVLNLLKGGSKVEVQTEKVKRRDITKTVTASGNIRSKRQLDVSASAIGKVTALAVREGDKVEKDDFLLQIDPTDYESMVDQLEASIRSGEATLEMEKANRTKTEYDLVRVEKLFEQQLVSEEELRNTRLAVDVSNARVKSAEENLTQQRANLKKARHDLREVRITADMSGTITTLNVDEGESAIMGTLNNPGTVLLTISDLSQIEAEVLVDETEVIFVKVGQPADVTLDAHPDTSFVGVVTEVGNSAVRSQLGLGQTSVDFKVVVAVKDSIPNVRPGLSASVEIEVANAKAALSVPIQSLTLRRSSDLDRAEEPARADSAEAKEKKDEAAGQVEAEEAEEGEDDEKAKDEIEGVFVVKEGKAVFTPVVVGIAGSSYFQVTSGLSGDEVIVTGPFKAITEVKNGDPVKVTKKPAAKRSSR